MGFPLFVALALWVSIAPTPAPAAARDDSTLLAAVDTLLARDRVDSALALLGPGIERVRAAGDRRLLPVLLMRQGSIHVLFSRPALAEPPLREALREAEARGDSAAICDALRWLAASVSTGGRTGESVILCRRLLSLARALHRREHEGLAEMMIAYHHLLTGNPARARDGYRTAIAIFTETGSSFWELWTRAGLGRAYGALGDIEGERACMIEIVERSRALGSLNTEAVALNNLGSLEFQVGDPSEALRLWQRVREIEIRTGIGAQMAVWKNLALALTALSRFDEAASLLDSAIARSERLGLLGDRYALLEQLGHVRRLQSRYPEAIALYRSVLAGDPLAGIRFRASAALGLSTALTSVDSAAAACALLERLLPAWRGQLPPDLRLPFELTLSEARLRLGRAPEALRPLASVEVEARRRGLQGQVLWALSLSARCERAMGHRDRAFARMREAVDAWEAQRGSSRDPEWREQSSGRVREIFSGIADHLLEGSEGPGRASADSNATGRAAQAFAYLQRFKSRTLLERMRGPGAGGTDDGPAESAITLALLQSSVLRPGELFLDTFVGSERTFLFAVSRDSFRAVSVRSGHAELGRRLWLFRQLLAAPPTANAAAPAAALEQTSRALGELLLHPVADLLAGHTRILISPDGPLNLIPFAVLVPSASGRDSALGVGHEIVLVPSATVLARLRREAAPPSSGVATILAMAGGVRADGTLLPGTRREIGALERRFQRVVVNRSGGGGATEERGLRGYDVLHLAAHTAIHDQRPWQSGMLLGVAPDRTPLVLRASQIAEMRLPARLAVLSGCESAVGQVISGEGVLGMTGAFLSAGVPSVVATLWPVDDHATSRFMEEFYGALASGKDAAGSLAQAQRRMRQSPRYRHPFFWAGFVLVGDGSTTLRLARRAAWDSAAFWVLVLVLAATLVVAATRRGRPRRRSP